MTPTPTDCPLCAPKPCIGGAHRNAMIEDGVIIANQDGIQLPAPTMEQQVAGSEYAERLLEKDLEEDFTQFEMRSVVRELIANERARVLAALSALEEAKQEWKDWEQLYRSSEQERMEVHERLAKAESDLSPARERIAGLLVKQEELTVALEIAVEDISEIDRAAIYTVKAYKAAARRRISV